MCLNYNIVLSLQVNCDFVHFSQTKKCFWRIYMKYTRQERSIFSTMLCEFSFSELCMLWVYVGICKILILLKRQSFGIKKPFVILEPTWNKQTKPKALLHFLLYTCIKCSDTQKKNLVSPHLYRAIQGHSGMSWLRPWQKMSKDWSYWSLVTSLISFSLLRKVNLGSW